MGQPHNDLRTYCNDIRIILHHTARPHHVQRWKRSIDGYRRDLIKFPFQLNSVLCYWRTAARAAVRFSRQQPVETNACILLVDCAVKVSKVIIRSRTGGGIVSARITVSGGVLLLLLV